MTKPTDVLKSCGPKLVPFFKTCAIFFVLFADTKASATSHPWFFCIIKCLPVLSLIFFVLLHGMNLTEYYRYARRILIGLILSCLGDICLVWPKLYFELGIGFFAIAHICYARAFGWKPLAPWTAIVFLCLGCVIYLILVTVLTGIMVYLAAAYVTIIATMAWRAVARVHFTKIFEDTVTWTQLSGCLGAIAFVISDITLAMDKFVFAIPYGHPLIMLTYYAGQFGIALSVVDTQMEEVLRSTREEHADDKTDTNTNSLFHLNSCCYSREQQEAILNGRHSPVHAQEAAAFGKSILANGHAHSE